MRLLTSKGKRSFIYSAIILFILGIFALGYLLYFIPNNRKTIHKNGFLILRTFSSNITERVESRVANYKNWVDNSNGSGDSIQSIFRSKNIEGIEIKTSQHRGSSYVSFRMDGNMVTISVKPKNRGNTIVEVSQSVDEFFEPLLAPLFSSGNTELFTFFALQKTDRNTAKIVYQNEELAIRTDVADSLLPKGSGSFVAGIRDFTSQQMEMKMFYYPFAIEGYSFIISGFAEEEKYTRAIKNIPVYFVYPLVVVFLLVLIFFPVIKFYVMDSNEPLGTKDVVFFGASAVLGVCLLTIMIIQLLLWQGEEKRVASNLRKISGQIQASFNTELNKIYRETELLDKYKKGLRNKLKNKNLSIDISNPVKSLLRHSKEDTSAYFHFDRISWIVGSGDQKIKAELYGNPVYTNVGTRNYVKVFKTGAPYSLPGSPQKKFGWEPIYSWTNNEFNISVSLQSKDTIVATATKMYSLVQTILPVGYGFCIIDEKGNVQVHSDGSRNLAENFLEKSDHPGELKGAIASRQSKIINYVVVYGKLHMLHVQPLNNSLPFYLVSFYDEGHITPINLRILIFTLVLCFLFFAMAAILWWVLGRKGGLAYKLVFCKMDFLDWMTPKSKEANFYIHAFAFTCIYVLGMLAIILFNPHYKVSNFGMLSLVLLTPVNIILVLHSMRLGFEKKRGKMSIYKSAIFHLVITIMFFLMTMTKYPLTINFLVVQFLINAVMWIYGLSPKDSLLLSLKSPFKFLKSYNLLITSVVICMAVLPASLFTWYAHNQELFQSLKRQQLYLANQIKERSFVIQQQPRFGDSMLPDHYFDSLQFSYGIYKIHSDKIDDSCVIPDKKEETGFESFYFDVAEQVSTPYYKQQSYAALEDGASDTSWHWAIGTNTMHFRYQPTIPRRRLHQQAVLGNCLHIASGMPERFVYLTPEKFFPTALIVLLLLFALYNWLGKNAKLIFLSRFIHSGKDGASKPNEFFASFFDKWPSALYDRLCSPARYKVYSTRCDPEKLLEHEKELVDDIKNGKEIYSYVWNRCTDKEKFLLYGFAVDGIVNYKNSKEIIEMMNKGLLVVEDERLRLFSPGFRAYILYSVDVKVISALQKQHRENSTWHYIRVPLMILLIGIAALVFYTQQSIFDKILVLAGGVSTLIGLVTRFFSGNATLKKA